MTDEQLREATARAICEGEWGNLGDVARAQHMKEADAVIAVVAVEMKSRRDESLLADLRAVEAEAKSSDKVDTAFYRGRASGLHAAIDIVRICAGLPRLGDITRLVLQPREWLNDLKRRFPPDPPCVHGVPGGFLCQDCSAAAPATTTTAGQVEHQGKVVDLRPCAENVMSGSADDIVRACATAVDDSFPKDRCGCEKEDEHEMGSVTILCSAAASARDAASRAVRALKGSFALEPSADAALALVRDIAEDGLRFDTNPTLRWGHGEEDMARQFIEYLRRIDVTVRERARKALGGVK